MALFSSFLHKMIQFWNMLDQMCPFQGYFILVTFRHLHDHHPEFLPDPVHLLLFVNTVPFKVSCFDKMDMVWKLMDQVFQLYLWKTSYLTPWPSSSLPPWPCPPATPLNEIGPFEMIGFDNISIIWKVFQSIAAVHEADSIPDSNVHQEEPLPLFCSPATLYEKSSILQKWFGPSWVLFKRSKAEWFNIISDR